MNGIDQELSIINPGASLAVLIRRNFKLIIILQMLSFLIMIGASNVVNAGKVVLIDEGASCPPEYKFQNNRCEAKRASYQPPHYSICSARETYSSLTGQCFRVDPLALLANDAGGTNAYTPSCRKSQIQDGDTCIDKCYRTHTMKNGSCKVKSSVLGQEYMTCPGRTTRQGTKCYDSHGEKVFKYILSFDCDHPSISNEWTKSVVIARLVDKKNRTIDNKTLGKQTLSKAVCTNIFLKNSAIAWSTETFKEAEYVSLEIKGGDGLYIDALRLKVNNKVVKWGKDGGKGLCMSTQRKDGGGSWKKFTDNKCWRVIEFYIKTGKFRTRY